MKFNSSNQKTAFYDGTSASPEAPSIDVMDDASIRKYDIERQQRKMTTRNNWTPKP